MITEGGPHKTKTRVFTRWWKTLRSNSLGREAQGRWAQEPPPPNLGPGLPPVSCGTVTSAGPPVVQNHPALPVLGRGGSFSTPPPSILPLILGRMFQPGLPFCLSPVRTLPASLLGVTRCPLVLGKPLKTAVAKACQASLPVSRVWVLLSGGWGCAH